MGERYDKPHLSFEGQLEKLEARGLHVENRSEALESLRRIGYYRLSAYLHTLREVSHKSDSRHDERLDTYMAGSTFGLVLQLWRFDRRLRLDVLDALEQIEVAFRTSLAYQAGLLHPFIHHHPELLAREFTQQPGTMSLDRMSGYDRWLVRYLERVERSTDEAFVMWFSHKYDGQLPIWVATELLEFGQSSRLLQGLPLAQRRMIASDFGVQEPKTFSSWIASFNGLRNVAAHHSRLWNRSLTSVARRPKEGQIDILDHLHALDDVARVKVYAPLAMSAWLLRDTGEGHAWAHRLLSTLDSFPALPQGSLANAGFPVGWRDLELWKMF
ncbi:MAG: Abi family protein [Cryobacterium sp.]|nr:Abi family protein [Cryobacterium sp.]